MNNQIVPSTGNPINIPNAPIATNNHVYQNGVQGQQPIPIGAVQVPPNGVNPASLNNVLLNLVLGPCARAVAKRLPILQSQGVNITEQVVLEKIFLAEFQIAVDSVRVLPATGIRAPQIKNRSRVPGSVRTVIPGYVKFYFPLAGQENSCWWTYSRGDKFMTNCIKPVGSNGIFCKHCYDNKKTAKKHYDNAAQSAGNMPIRDWLLSLRNRSPHAITNTRPAVNQIVPPKPANEGQISVDHYPGNEGILYRTAEGIIYAHRSNGITAIGFDISETGTILPFSQGNRGLVYPNVQVDDSLAQQYSLQGGLRADILDASGNLAGGTSTAVVPNIPLAQTNNAAVIPQGIPGTNNAAVIPQGIPGTNNAAVIPQNIPVANNAAVIPQGIPVANNAAVIPQSIPVANTAVIPQNIPVANNTSVIPQNIPVANNVAVIPQSIPVANNVAVIPQGIPGASNVAPIAPIAANTKPVPVASALPGALATPLVGITSQT